MGNGNHNATRREFLRQSCLAAAGAGCASLVPFAGACSKSEPEAPQKAAAAATSARPPLHGRVTTLADAKVFATTGRDPKRIDDLFQRSIAALADVKDYREGMRALFDPKDVVALKLNCLAGRPLSSTPEVVGAVVRGLEAIGVPLKNIIVWERTTAELERAGFEINRYAGTRYRCYGTDRHGYTDQLEFSGDVGSLFSKIIAEQATALINVPVLKDHDLSGVGCAMKNMYGAIHNPNRYHDNNCSPFVAQVSNHRFIKDKLRLTVADALTAQYHGGPAAVLDHQWRPGTLLTATDPVALDTVAQQILEAKRSEKGLPSFAEAKRPPKWIPVAAKLGLGEHRPDKISQIS